ncbi:MAG TPA: hypothetical protein VMU50_14170, partial [Polyangia bacterium]|nr:hypothetical protein [Polyangia bacterium]
MGRRRFPIAAAALLAAMGASPPAARAHVGSPDVFLEGQAGPYKLLVTVQPPQVIPGVAAVEVQAAGDDDLHLVSIVPTPLRGPGAAVPPTADRARPSPDDARRFTGKLWLMSPGSWQVRVHVEGARGSGDLAVPVPALPMRTKAMQRGLGLGLVALLAFLVAGVVSIVGASVREAPLQPGETPELARRRRARIAQAAAFVVMAALVGVGGAWWSGEA